MRIFLLFSICFFLSCSIFSQPAGVIDETFNLKYLSTFDRDYYTPNGENPTFIITQNGGGFSFSTDGIMNMLSGEVAFDSGQMTLHSLQVNSTTCDIPDCYFEDVYFYEVLSNPDLEDKNFTYRYRESDGYKYFSIFGNGNAAFFSTAPAEEPNPLLFRTWYLTAKEYDMGGYITFSGPDVPRITINEDLTFTGIDGCALIQGDFILGNSEDYDFILQTINYTSDESQCPPGTVNYNLDDLKIPIPLGCLLFLDNQGEYNLIYESYPGFISYFRESPRLALPENQMKEFSVFPNPAEDKLYLDSNDLQNIKVSIIDMNGRDLPLPSTNSDFIDVSHLSSGMHFLSLKSQDGIQMKRFIKK